MARKVAIIIGAGPAGLTAAYEFLCRSDIKPIVIESEELVGGLAKTINYKGNRIDLGGHRFFSKSDVVMNWWQHILPLQGSSSGVESVTEISYQRKKRSVNVSNDGPDPKAVDNVMLIRERLSRILFQRKLFDYPVTLNFRTIRYLGLFRLFVIFMSYMKAHFFPISDVRSLEDVFINKFGKKLYLLFFKEYTEKVWGVPTDHIQPEWGDQRVKGLSLTKALLHAVTRKFKSDSSVAQKGTETSLIEHFLYPKYGPGQMWEVVARRVEELGGEILSSHNVVALQCREGNVVAVECENKRTGERRVVHGDYVLSTMPVKDLIECLGEVVPDNVREIASGLQYRDFIMVGLLLRRLSIKQENRTGDSVGLVPDNWIYIQESDVKVGRLQIYNNWSPYMVRDPNTVWLGAEYFCTEGDELWRKTDDEIALFAQAELETIDVIERKDVLDYIVIRAPKAYPAYFGTYDQFHVIRLFTDSIRNLFLVGRNGMHRYNNQDHSMLTAMAAVENIINGKYDKENIWSVNIEEEYHETISSSGDRKTERRK